jgi:hypothetical protein
LKDVVCEASGCSTQYITSDAPTAQMVQGKNGIRKFAKLCLISFQCPFEGKAKGLAQGRYAVKSWNWVGEQPQSLGKQHRCAVLLVLATNAAIKSNQ